MEDFKKLPQNLQTQNNFDRLVELEQQKLGLEKLRLEQSSTGTDSYQEDSTTTAEVSQDDGGISLTSPLDAKLQEFVDKLLSLLLGAKEAELATSLWSVPGTLKQLRKFANDTSVSVIYLSKIQDDTSIPTYTYTLGQDIAYGPKFVASIVLIKEVSSLDPNRSLDTQIHIANLPGPAATKSDSAGVLPYVALRSYIHHAFMPYFNAYIDAKGVNTETIRAQRDDFNLKKMINELEMALFNLEHDIKIPGVVLDINPVIQAVIDKCKAERTPITVDAIDPTYLTESTFLNKLQSEVNGWVKKIQKVTQLEQDPATATASQEINFWLNMEKSLEAIERQVKSEEVTFTMELLKTAKRFHVTTSFYADTRLKEATEKVHRYNQLMKDFPLNELLSATDFGQIRHSLRQIFNHLNRKLKLSPYPIKSALHLVEAISRDLNDKLLKVLGNCRLMYAEYDDFERLISSAEEVFYVWDECMKDFTNVARDIARKRSSQRSEKFTRIHINPAHATLHERISLVKNFRKQHERLHQNVVNVMTQEAGSVSMSVIEALNEAYEKLKDINVLDVSPEGTEIWTVAENAYNERLSRIEQLPLESHHTRSFFNYKSETKISQI